MDFSAVAIASSLLGLLLAALVGVASRWVPDARGAGYWGLAFVPLAIGSAMLARGESLPPLLLVLREPVLLSGYGLLLIGLRHHLRLARPWAFTGGVLMASLVACAGFVAVWPVLEARLLVRNCGIFLLTGAAWVSLGTLARPGLREVRRYLRGSFGLIALLALLRIGLFSVPSTLDPAQVVQLNAGLGMVTAMLLVAVITGLALLMTADMNEALAELTVRDPLTRLFNRRGLEEAVATTLSFSRRVGRPVAVLACDIDHFKRINDRFGHAGGDAVLQSFAAVLASSFRTAELVARLGGEEFVVVLPGADDDRALGAAQKLRHAVLNRRFSAGEPGEQAAVTVSIGVASMPASQVTWDELLRRADAALYEAKSRGRNCCMLAPQLPAPAQAPPGAPWRAAPREAT